MVLPCIDVKLSVFAFNLIQYPIGIVVRKLREEILPGIRVVSAYPIPCQIAPSTEIEIVSRCDVEVEELKTNYLLHIKYPKYTNYLIYPKKTWNKLYKRYISRLAEGLPPKQPGVLLYGAPGTGKTSFIEMTAQYLGLYMVSIDSSILSPYIGETEKALLSRFTEVETHEPSLLAMDDLDWMLGKRKQLLGSATSGAEAFLLSSLLQLVLKKLPEWKKNNRRILTVVATNINPEIIDPALARSERLGRKPVFVPLPNYEAIYTLMDRLGVSDKIGEKETEKYAKRLANMGFNMADVRDVIDDILEGEEPEIEPKRGRGYTRPIPYDIINAPKLFKRFDKIFREFIFKNPNARFRSSIPSAVAEAIFVEYFAHRGIPVVLLNDERYFDEALTTAKTTESVLLVDIDYFTRDDLLKIIHQISPRPTIFMGERTLGIKLGYDILKPDILKQKEYKEEALRLLFAYYNIKVSDTFLRMLLYKSYDIFKEFALAKYVMVGADENYIRYLLGI